MTTYPREVTDPIRASVRAQGLTEATTPQEVDAALAQPGTTLVFVNSVCGCAGGVARPALSKALAGARCPDRTVVVFAGVDIDATARARQSFSSMPPSSPSAALLKDGKPVWTLSRSQIQGRMPEDVAAELTAAFAAHCSGKA